MMKKLFGEKPSPETLAREAIHRRKWAKALDHYEAKARDAERDFALWNFVGDLHLNNASRAQAVEAWRRAIEGYAMEGMHENVIGIAKKALRQAPSEEDLYLQIATAYLGLNYPADCLAAVRSYVKLAKQRSEPELRAAFKRIVESDIRHPHLLEELRTIYAESKVDDFELKCRVDEYVNTRAHRHDSDEAVDGEPTPMDSLVQDDALVVPDPVDVKDEVISATGLFTLDTANDGMNEDAFRPRAAAAPYIPENFDFNPDADAARWESGPAIPEGDGKDHFDLGVVYRDMKLWEAAIREFTQARRDPTLRTRATLALAECLQESGDLQGALGLLESERDEQIGSTSEKIGLHFQLGIIHELLGNLDDALKEFEFVQQQNSEHEEAGKKVQALARRLGRSVSR